MTSGHVEGPGMFYYTAKVYEQYGAKLLDDLAPDAESLWWLCKFDDGFAHHRGGISFLAIARGIPENARLLIRAAVAKGGALRDSNLPSLGETIASHGLDVGVEKARIILKDFDGFRVMTWKLGSEKAAIRSFAKHPDASSEEANAARARLAEVEAAMPTQDELEQVLDKVWARIGGRFDRPRIRAGTPGETGDASGVLNESDWVILLGLVQHTPSGLVGTLTHEAVHARLARQFPLIFSAVRAAPVVRFFARGLDEYLAYTADGIASRLHTGNISDAAMAVFEPVIAGITMHGSLSWKQRIPPAVLQLLLAGVAVNLLLRWLEDHPDRGSSGTTFVSTGPRG